jgi:4-oxalocrotonate tautomerase
VIYTAMTGVLSVPNDDRFMVITEHDQADLVISPEHLGIGHTADVMLIQVTRNEGRTVPVKWDFYRAAADGLHERTGLRREDVIICLVEVKKENWSGLSSPTTALPQQITACSNFLQYRSALSQYSHEGQPVQ